MTEKKATGRSFKPRKLIYKKLNKVKIPYFGLKLAKEINYFLFRVKGLAYSFEFNYLRKLFFFYFMRYTLSIFNTKLNIVTLAETKKGFQPIKLVYSLNQGTSIQEPKHHIQKIKYTKIISDCIDSEQQVKENNLNIITRINFEL